jgi:hypothetical protein
MRLRAKMNGVPGEVVYQRKAKPKQWEWRPVGLNRPEPVPREVKFKRYEEGNGNR